MPSRKLLVPLLAATAVFALAACEPDNSAPSDSAADAGRTTAAAPAPAPVSASASAPAPAATTRAPAPGTPSPDPAGQDPATSDDPDLICPSPGDLPAGLKIVYPSKVSATALTAKETKAGCGVNDVVYQATGADKSFPLATGAVAVLHSVENTLGPITVTVAELQTHIADCAAQKPKPAHPCSSGDYEITLNAAGKVTRIKERPSS
ncbi:hypothetical protein [Kitasatospora sp. NPDC057223]|uniref:hypothetical protein n=1 Tax=Kitasatospora sp. NPDC057223 TaxID=3346055 RepID=UPI00362D6360